MRSCLNFIINILVPIVALMAISCDPVSTDAPQFEVKDKTVLVYMAGNNNLAPDAADNLESLKKGYVPEEDNLLVYYHTTEQNPVMLRIYKDGSGAVVQDTVYRFPQRNSSVAESLKSAMQVTGTMFPAEEYGLFLWSHGTGWLPEGYYTKSFGSENGIEMEIPELVDAIPYKLSFVVFDACLMGCVEVAYQMKDSVDYIISSPTEVLTTGFPYAVLMKHIYRETMDLEAVAREYYDFYNGQSGQFRSATISLVKTSALEEVAQKVKEVFEKYRHNISGLSVGDVQRYWRSGKRWFFDLGDFIKNIAPEEDAAPVLEALEKAVVFKAATPQFLEITIDPDRYSGLSTYIPIAPSDTLLDNYYAGLDWNKAVEMIKMQED